MNQNSNPVASSSASSSMSRSSQGRLSPKRGISSRDVCLQKVLQRQVPFIDQTYTSNTRLVSTSRHLAADGMTPISQMRRLRELRTLSQGTTAGRSLSELALAVRMPRFRAHEPPGACCPLSGCPSGLMVSCHRPSGARPPHLRLPQG